MPVTRTFPDASPGLLPMPQASDSTPRSRALFQRRGAAIAAVLAGVSAALMVWVFHSSFPKNGFLFLYIPMIGGVAYTGGRRPGLLTTLVSLMTAWYFIIQPGNPLSIHLDSLSILLMLAVAGVLVVECAVRIREAEVTASGLALIVESSDDAIFSKSLDGTILTWNAGAERLYGYTAAEMIGRPVSTLAPPDRANEVPDILARLRRGKRVDHYESVRVRKDGTRLDLSLTISPVRDKSGKIVGAATIARDITERKRAEQALHRLRADDELLNAIATRTAGETQLDRLLAVALEQLQQRVNFSGGSMGETYLADSAGAPPLGVAMAQLPPSQAIPLEPGMLLVLYTDGLIELTRDPAEGETALLAAAAAEKREPSGDPARGILARVLQNRQAADDIAVVTLSISAAPAEDAGLTLTLPAEPRSSWVVRQAFKRLALAIKS